ncbi:DUF1214 domain-containing protein [Bacteroidota bacterium]
MRKLLYFFLGILGFFRKFRMKFSGKTEEDIHTQRVVSGKAWNEFCDNLKLAGNVLVFPGTPRDAFQQAEGLRYLSRLVRGGLEGFVEFGDPDFPVFKRVVHETVKLGADNPDNHYLNASINGNNEYKISGKRNTIHYFGFFTQNGTYGTTGGLSPCGVLEHYDMEFDEDGSFEIILSKEKKGKNWLKIEDETTIVMIRQTYFDRNKETPVDVTIKNLNGKNAPDPLSAEKIDEGLKMAGLFAAGAPLLFAKWAKGFQKHTNKLPIFDPEISNAAGGDANIIYHHSYWKLKSDEALVIEVLPPECDSWNFQLNNYWMESLDYRYFDICISKGNAVYNDDGSVRIIVSNEDPGLPNWIQCCDHNEGTMCWRWYRLKEGTDAVEPMCKVVSISKLRIKN